MKEEILKKIISVALPLSIFPIIGSLLPGNAYILVTLAGTILTAPLLDKKFTEIQRKEDKNKIREQHYLSQLKIGLAEMDKKGTRVNSMTPFFTDMIQNKFKKHKINIDEDTLQNINQFLYMINSNYYDEILKVLQTNNQELKTREDVLNSVCEAIIKNMEQEEDYAFDDLSVEGTLSTIDFIEPETKKSMEEEFTNSKVPGVFGKCLYIIERKDIKKDNIEKDYTKKYQEVSKNNLSFDIYERESYIDAISRIGEMDYYKKLGNVNTITWDIDALMDIITHLIYKFNEKLERQDNKYSIARFSLKILLGVTSYALVNNKKNVSYNEIIASFKNLSNIPGELKAEMINYLEEYKKTVDTKNKQKILIFNPNYKRSQI